LKLFASWLGNDTEIFGLSNRTLQSAGRKAQLSEQINRQPNYKSSDCIQASHMIIGERKASEFVLLLVIALLVIGFIAVVWFYRKQTPTPMRKSPAHSASLLPDKPEKRAG